MTKTKTSNVRAALETTSWWENGKRYTEMLPSEQRKKFKKYKQKGYTVHLSADNRRGRHLSYLKNKFNVKIIKEQSND